MFILLLSFFIGFVAVDAFFSAAVLYHLRKYTLPGWTAAKAIVPAYLLLSLVFLGFALYFFLQIPFPSS